MTKTQKPKNKTILWGAGAALISFFLIASLYFGAAQNNQFREIAKVLSLKGDVEIRRYGQIEYQPLTKGEKIFHLDHVRTNRNAQVVLSVSNSHKASLGPFSEIVLQYWNANKYDSPIYIDQKKGYFKALKVGSKNALYALKGSELVQFPVDAPDAPSANENAQKSLHSTLTNEQIKALVTENEELLQRCLLNALRESNRLNGRIVVGFSILNEGKTEEVKILKSSIEDSEFESCVTSVFQRLKFPPFRGKNIYISYPLKFGV